MNKGQCFSNDRQNFEQWIMKVYLPWNRIWPSLFTCLDFLFFSLSRCSKFWMFSNWCFQLLFNQCIFNLSFFFMIEPGLPPGSFSRLLFDGKLMLHWTIVPLWLSTQYCLIVVIFLGWWMIFFITFTNCYPMFYGTSLYIPLRFWDYIKALISNIKYSINYKN